MPGTRHNALIGFGLLATLLVAAALGPGTAAAALHLDRVGRVAAPGGDLTSVAVAPGDPGALYVTQRSGVVRRTKDGKARTFLNLAGPVRDSGNEQGLFSIAFAPGRRSNRFYVFYSDASGDERLDEFRTTAGGAARPATRRQVLLIPHRSGDAHYAGNLQFGPDGFLYLSTGDAQDSAHSQDLGSLLGKILRIDPRRRGGNPYSVPRGNPFVGRPGRDEIWSYGLRNPFKFSFDRATGAMLIGDVGDATAEEIDFVTKASGAGRGVNFGWPCREGFAAGPVSCTAPKARSPVFAYPHTTIDGAPRCAVIAGFVARGPGLAGVHGRFLYADLCSGQIRSIALGGKRAGGDRLEVRRNVRLEAFGQDGRGRLYVAIAEGLVYRLRAAAGGRELSPRSPRDYARTVPAILHSLW